MKMKLRDLLTLCLLLAFVGLAVSACDDSESQSVTDTGDQELADDAEGDSPDFACSSSCTEEGALMCENNAILQCTDERGDGCLEWSTQQSCGLGTICSEGACVIPTCDNQECTTPGAKQCGDANDVQTCADLDGDGCLEWSEGLACDGELFCANGLCVDECVNECTAIGAKDCDDNGDVVSCDDHDNDGCLDWGNPQPCASGLICSLGACASECSSGCTVVGARQCDTSGAVVLCGDYNSDGCLEWGDPVPCDDPLVCSEGYCAATCTNGCDYAGARQCVSGTTSQFQVCGDYNSDGCLEWGTPETCDTGLVCGGAGICAATCSDSCFEEGALQCYGNAVQTCGDYNSDGCIEWGTPAACEAYESCSEGVCNQDSPEESVIISEFVYNTEGSPDTETFIELYGPAGTDLSGFSLVGVNGTNGSDLATITLSGVIDSSQLFLIAHPSATGALAANADMSDAGVDLQNSPDSLQLRYGSLVVDAVAYGSFSDSEFPAGEGDPAPAAGVDESLSRDENFTDTDNNAADFHVVSEPTPGTPAATPNGAPVALINCPGSGEVGASLSFDGTGSSDDGSIVSYDFDFGDGSSDSGVSVSHSYSSAATFTVTLTVTDDGGLTDTATCAIEISEPNDPPVAALSCPNTGIVDTELSVDASASTDDGSMRQLRL